MNKILNYVVNNFGFDNTKDFMTSLLHHKLIMLTIPFAAISSVIESLLGLHSLTILSFVVLITLELITGLIGAKISGKKIESRKFGRFGLKIFVWVTLLFVLNSFRIEYKGHEDYFGPVAFRLLNWLHGTLFIYINLEYLISVLENLGTISGKDNTSIIIVIKDKLKNFISNDKK